MNKKAKRLLSFALILAMTAGCFITGGAAGGDASRSGDEQETDTLAQTGAIASAAVGSLRSHGGEQGKEETVYVIADASGEPTRQIVSAWLKNPDEAASITDRADLENIQNTKGDETYTVDEAGNIVWAANGNDIYYQGDSTQAPPISVHVCYTLDGKSVDPERLAGASGHLVMTFTYENNTRTTRMVDGQPTVLYQPFAAVSCAVLDSEKATNVAVTNGRLVNLGEQLVVAGLALPGLKQSLGLDQLEDADGNPVDIDIPEEVVVSADVTDFSLLTTLTIAENSLLGEVDLENVDSFDELEASIDELTDASTQLADGSSQLYDGTVALSDGAGSLSDGVTEVSDGASAIASNMGDLSSGLNSLQSGASSLASGLDSLESQVQGLPSGVSALSGGAQTLKSALQTQLKPGADSLQAGAQTVSDTLRNQLAPGAAALQTGAESISAGANQIQTGAAGIQTIAQTIAGGADQIAAGAQTIKDQLGASAGTLTGAVDTVTGQLTSVGTEIGNEAAALQQQLAALQNAEGLTEDQKNTIAGIAGSIQTSLGNINNILRNAAGSFAIDTSGFTSANDGLQNIIDGAHSIAAWTMDGDGTNPGIHAIAGSIAEGAGDIAAGAMSGSEDPETYGIYEGAGALAAGAETLAAEGSDALAAGAGALSAGVDTIISGNNGNNLDALISGLNTLSGSSQALVSGVGQLSSGADTLKQGAGTAAAGARQLADGANTLASGTQTLKSGTQQLTDGISELVDGASELMDGMSQFDEEGIQTLSQLVETDAQTFFDRLRTLQDYAEEYTSFSGSAPGTPSTVRFIIRTDSIKKP